MKNVTNTVIVVNDHRIRPTDQGQVVVGTYYEDFANSQRHCFIARLDRKGVYMTSIYFKNNPLNFWSYPNGTQSNKYYSECNAVTLTKNKEVIAAGTYLDTNINGYLKTSALIIKSEFYESESVSNELYTHSIQKLWSSANNQIGKDVTTTDDGGIYVTGSVSGWSQGGYDCFILRLNETLDRVFVKSFGSSMDEYCVSIQVTRNNDYIYIGGHRLDTGTSKQEIMFFKLDAYGDTFISTKYIQPATVEKFSLRRIILSKENAFSNTNDNNEIFFCGSSSSFNGGDFIYGKLDSTFSIQRAYRYGTPSTELVGDCALTSDNLYFIGLLNSKYYRPRTSSVSQITTQYYGATSPPLSFSQSTPFQNCLASAVGNNPFGGNAIYGALGLVACKPYSMSTLLSSSDYQRIRDDCVNSFWTKFNAYVQEYQNMYTWTSCQYYYLDFNAMKCDINTLTFSGCDASNQITECENHAGTTYCDTFSCDLSSNLTSKPWFTSGYGDDEFRNLGWFKIQNISRSLWFPFQFCDQYRPNPSNTYSDKFNYVFEQDCTEDPKATNLTYDWFIIRVKVSDINSNTLTSMPEEAAFFGDRSGDEIAQSIQIDDSGYITIHGTSNSPNFGAIDSNEYVWLYAKTHFSLQWELKKTTSYDTPELSYLQKRFVQPKKFKNSGSLIFLINLLNANESTTGSYTTALIPTPLPINEDVGSFPTNNSIGLLYIFSNNLVSYYSVIAQTYGVSYYSMNNQFEYKVYKNVQFSLGLPYFCTLTADNRNYGTRKYSMNIGTVTGLVFTYIPDNSAIPEVTANLSLSEGIYYADLLGTQTRTDYNFSVYSCYLSLFWENFNTETDPSLKRFMIRQRIKFIVDDEYQNPPSLLKAIQDITITIGHRYNSVDYRNYFQGTCITYSAKRAKLTSTYRTRMLPYWIQFSEQNGTFTMYPPYVTNPPISNSSYDPIYLELQCCNKIYECASATFQVKVTDEDPVLDTAYLNSKTIIQYDSTENVGEHYYWSANSLLFSDADSVTGDSANDPYNHQSHVVWVTQISTNNGFDSIKQIGMIFGQAFGITLNNLGSNTIQFQYQDLYSQTQILRSSFKVFINRLPQKTSQGISYAFATIDPHLSKVNTTFFDDLFPFVKDKQTTNVVSIDLTKWFSELDIGDSLTYYCSNSDNSIRDKYIGLDQSSGQLRIYPSMMSYSQLLNLKIYALDENQGYQSYFKTLLINSPPKTKRILDLVVIGVNRQFSIDINKYFYDEDGDNLKIIMPIQSEITRIRDLGFDFYQSKKIVSGKCSMLTTVGSIQFRATDPHGDYATFYLTIRFVESKPLTKKQAILQDQIINERARFSFKIQNNLFYDTLDQRTLIVFASTQDDEDLPDWIHYDPVSMTFYGIAPPYGSLKDTSIVIQLRAVNDQTHDSVSAEFTLTVKPNDNPKTNVKFIYDDIQITENSWLNMVIVKPNLFKDYDYNYQPQINIQGAYGIDLPDWIKFNQENRSIFGQAQYYSNQTNYYIIDIEFQDDLGSKTFTNLKLRVNKKQDQSEIAGVYYLTCSTFAALFIYFSYAFYFAVNLIPVDPFLKRIREGAMKRFQGYKDVQIDFFQGQKKEEKKNNDYNRVTQEDRVIHLDSDDNFQTQNCLSDRSPLSYHLTPLETASPINTYSKQFFIRRQHFEK